MKTEIVARPMSQQRYLQRTDVIKNPVCSVIACVPDAVTLVIQFGAVTFCDCFLTQFLRGEKLLP